MYCCGAAWRAGAARLAAVSSAARLGGSPAPLRQMSSGSFPGSSGENLIYYVFTGVTCAAGGYYAYRTVTTNKERYNERIHAIQQSNVAEWKPKSWPPQCDETETAEVSDASEQATEAPTEEAEALTADEATEQNEGSMVSTEAEGEKGSPVADASSAVEEAQQEATASLEAAQVQGIVMTALNLGSSDRTRLTMGQEMLECIPLGIGKSGEEIVGEAMDGLAASAQEDHIDRIQEGTASAGQEMPDTSSRKTEAVADGSGQASEATSATTGSEEVRKDA